MNQYFIHNHYPALVTVLLLVSCQTIPEWDKESVDNPVEDGRCPDLSGRFNYEHLGANDTRGLDSILGDNLTSNLPTDRVVPAEFKASGAIYLKIYKGKYFDAYPGTILVTLTHSDQTGRIYHVRVDWDLEGLLGEYNIAFDKTWICSSSKLLRLARSTLHERPDPDEIDPRDYRRIYVLPNGNIRIDRKHTFIARWDTSHLARYYESRVFARIP